MAKGSFALLLIASSGAAAAAGAARADWQYTRWGMTPDEVVAASNGAVQLGPVPEGKTYLPLVGRARGTFQMGGAHFAAFFHFDANNRLAKVALERSGGTACSALLGALGTRHGRPAKSQRQSNYLIVDEWHDRVGGNMVRYIQVSDLPCTITYDVLRTQ